MDPVTAAILAAIATGALAGVAQATQTAVAGLYQSLKSKIAEKFGHAPELSTALVQLEERPDSPARKALVEEEVVRSGAASDPDILAIAQSILRALEGSGAAAHTQVATGNYIAQADRQSQASVTVDKPKGD